MKLLKLMVLSLIMFLMSCSGAPEQKEEAVLTQPKGELIKRGRYLVTIGACHDCHSPKIMTPQGPEPDPLRLLSGHPANEKLLPPATNASDWTLFSPGLTAFIGPWGTSFAANLTPDDTGTGSWSFEQFKTAIRKGKYKGLEGSRDLLPPMPWQMYRNFTDDDLLAVFTYLQSLPPVENLVPAPIPPAVASAAKP